MRVRSLLALCACDPVCVCVCARACVCERHCVIVIFAKLCMKMLIFIFFVRLFYLSSVVKRFEFLSYFYFLFLQVMKLKYLCVMISVFRRLSKAKEKLLLINNVYTSVLTLYFSLTESLHQLFIHCCRLQL